MKLRAVVWVVLLFCAPFLLAMGTGDSEGPTRIPEPSADFRVRLTDQEGTRVVLTQFSIEGQVFVLGEMGQGQVAVPLEKVKEVEITNQGDALKARIVLNQGPPVEIRVKPTLTATGKTAFGNYRIPLGEVSRLEVLGQDR